MDAEQYNAAFDTFAAAVERAGGQSGFERLTGARQQSVSNWLRKRKLLPGEFVLTAEQELGASRHDLRPDLYPREPARTDVRAAEACVK